MRDADREAVRQREGFRCGYCGVHEEDVGSRLSIDHYRPRSHEGTDDRENLVYCCAACNSFKGDYWAEGGAEDRILHPVEDSVTLHVAINSEQALIGLSRTGRFHIQHLHLNRPELMVYRQKRAREATLDRLIKEREAEISQLVEHVRNLEAEAEALLARLRYLDRGNTP